MGRLQLIVDGSTLRILSSFLKMGDLHAEGVTSMELLERQREPLPELDALYLLMPGPQNVELVLKDFAALGTPQHRQVHLGFCDALPMDLMARLAEPASGTTREVPGGSAAQLRRNPGPWLPLRHARRRARTLPGRRRRARR